MKKVIFSSVLLLIVLSSGCRYCCTPYDNCGPVFANPHNCEWNYRSGSAFNQETVPAEGQIVDGQMVTDGQVIADGEVIADGQVIMDGQTVDGASVMDGEVIEAVPGSVPGSVPEGTVIPVPTNGTIVPGAGVPEGAALPTDGYMVYKKFNGV